mmetsp:Transcript_1233/g.2710  ORF Transcript_1233/g.2710 Transcript_1233/m.2710 type:complete len:479 (-) Transcript_1233:338-1774(-)
MWLGVKEPHHHHHHQPTPPGLDGPAESKIAPSGDPEARAARLRLAQEKLQAVTSSEAEREEILKAVREAVMQEVDARVQAKTDELWTRARQMFSQLQTKHKEHDALILEQVQKCRESCIDLEQENMKHKQTLTGLCEQFNRIGRVFGAPEASPAALGSGKQPPASPTPQATSGGNTTPKRPPTTPPRTTEAKAMTPHRSDGEGSGLNPAALPKVPDFPSHFSISEALSGSLTPHQEKHTPPRPHQHVQPQHHRTPLSLAQTLSPTIGAEAASALSGAPGLTPPFGLLASPLLGYPRPPPSTPATTAAAAAPAAHFTVTMRKADGGELGLSFSTLEKDQVLKVVSIDGGAVEAFNRQVAGGAQAEKTIYVGDKIISVNGFSYDPPKMLEECKAKQLCKLTVVRGDRPLPAPVQLPAKASPPKPKEKTAATPPQPPPSSSTATSKNSVNKCPRPGGSPTQLRADASVFVPSASSSESGAQ